MNAMLNSTWLAPAFADPVRDSQMIFRMALSAVAEPGTIHRVECAPAIEALQAAAYGLCLTLLDADTPVWLGAGFDSVTLRANLAFHCGCPIAQRPDEAAFAVLAADDLQALSRFDAGSDRDPDRSCSLIVQLPILDDGHTVVLRGPGIQGERRVRLPLDTAFWDQRAQVNDFPKGLDLFLCADTGMMALPRSTRAEVLAKEVA